MADFVVWDPAFFGVRPHLVVKGGVPVWGAMGDAAASYVFSEPVLQRRAWGFTGDSAAATSALFVSQLAIDHGFVTSLGLRRAIVAMADVRSLGKRHMVRNDALPVITVDPATFDVRADGVLLHCEPAAQVPLSTRYLLR